jgi:hypothetical protein
MGAVCRIVTGRGRPLRSTSCRTVSPCCRRRWSAATPTLWFYGAKELIEAGRFGPVDIEETFDDAVDRAILDQEEAGLDIISDGEMRRASFVWAFASG